MAAIMSYEILDSSGGTLSSRISGKLSYDDFVKGQTQAMEILRAQSKARCPILLENYQDTEKEGNWDDLAFVAEADKHVEKLALVGGNEWKAATLLFTGQGLRPFPVEYIEIADLAEAKAWLAT
jgi:hypothetical protein